MKVQWPPAMDFQLALSQIRFSFRRRTYRWALLEWTTVAMGIALGAFILLGIVPAAHNLEDRIADASARPLRNSMPLRHSSEDDARGQLKTFYRSFPPDKLILDFTEQLNQIAGDVGARIAQADYRMTNDPSGLKRFEIAIAMQGTYPQLRAFTATSLSHFPTASLEGLTLSRGAVSDTMLETQLHFAVFVVAD